MDPMFATDLSAALSDLRAAFADAAAAETRARAARAAREAAEAGGYDLYCGEQVNARSADAEAQSAAHAARNTARTAALAVFWAARASSVDVSAAWAALPDLDWSGVERWATTCAEGNPETAARILDRAALAVEANDNDRRARWALSLAAL